MAEKRMIIVEPITCRFTLDTKNIYRLNKDGSLDVISIEEFENNYNKYSNDTLGWIDSDDYALCINDDGIGIIKRDLFDLAKSQGKVSPTKVPGVISIEITGTEAVLELKSYIPRGNYDMKRKLQEALHRLDEDFRIRKETYQHSSTYRNGQIALALDADLHADSGIVSYKFTIDKTNVYINGSSRLTREPKTKFIADNHYNEIYGYCDDNGEYALCFTDAFMSRIRMDTFFAVRSKGKVEPSSLPGIITISIDRSTPEFRAMRDEIENSDIQSYIYRDRDSITNGKEYQRFKARNDKYLNVSFHKPSIIPDMTHVSPHGWDIFKKPDGVYNNIFKDKTWDKSLRMLSMTIGDEIGYGYYGAMDLVFKDYVSYPAVDSVHMHWQFHDIGKEDTVIYGQEIMSEVVKAGGIRLIHNNIDIVENKYNFSTDEFSYINKKEIVNAYVEFIGQHSNIFCLRHIDECTGFAIASYKRDIEILMTAAAVRKGVEPEYAPHMTLLPVCEKEKHNFYVCVIGLNPAEVKEIEEHWL